MFPKLCLSRLQFYKRRNWLWGPKNMAMVFTEKNDVVQRDEGKTRYRKCFFSCF